MAGQILNLTKILQKLSLKAGASIISSLDAPRTSLPQVLFTNSVRSTNFFNKLPADALWKGVTSVSNAGKRRGRGRANRRNMAKDLNKGQVIGWGKKNILWPGLNAPIIRGKELVVQQQLPPDPDREAKLAKIRDEMGTFRFLRLNPIERGWSGSKMPGRSIGPPDPVGEDTFDGFDTIVLELKTVFNTKGNFGRTRRLSIMAVTGNKQGLAGFALVKAIDSKAGLRKVKNRAGQKLMYIQRFEDHTVYHDFFTQFGSTKIFVYKKPEGYGLICHRAIKAICEVIGIKNIYAKVEGSPNLQHIVKAFILGLLRQKTHEQIAEEKGLHLVEFCKENDYFPRVVASPTQCRKKEELKPDEVLDFTQYCFENRVVLKRKKFPPFYAQHWGYLNYLKRQENVRNQDKVRRDLMAEYGEVKSYLTDQYPECRPFFGCRKKGENEEETN